MVDVYDAVDDKEYMLNIRNSALNYELSQGFHLIDPAEATDFTKRLVMMLRQIHWSIR